LYNYEKGESYAKDIGIYILVDSFFVNNSNLYVRKIKWLKKIN